MSRFKIIIAIVLFAVLVVGLFVVKYVSSLHQVDLTITSGLHVNIYQVIDNKNQPTLKTVSSSTKLSLQDGNYCAQPTDTDYDTTPVCFTLSGKDISVTVEPGNSVDYLARLLPGELPKINNLINTKYSAVINNFTLNTGALYEHGDWYGGTLTENVSQPSDQGDVYRFILHKVSGVWQIAAFPQITVNKYEYPNIPYSVLDAVNRLVGPQF